MFSLINTKYALITPKNYFSLEIKPIFNATKKLAYKTASQAALQASSDPIKTDYLEYLFITLIIDSRQYHEKASS